METEVEVTFSCQLSFIAKLYCFLWGVNFPFGSQGKSVSEQANKASGCCSSKNSLKSAFIE